MKIEFKHDCVVLNLDNFKFHLSIEDYEDLLKKYEDLFGNKNIEKHFIEIVKKSVIGEIIRIFNAR